MVDEPVVQLLTLEDTGRDADEPASDLC